MADTNILGWDDTIENDGGEYIVLPEGDYPFTVTSFERGSFPGGAKIPACNMAKVFLRVDGGELGKALCVENIYLLERLEWKAAAFLRAIGLKKHGEPIAWRQLVHCDGETGRCRVYVDEFTDKNGQTKQSNKIRSFYDKEEQAPKKEFKRGAF